MIIDIMQWVAIAVLFYFWLSDLRLFADHSSKQIYFKKRDELPLHQECGIEPKLPPKDTSRPAPPPRGKN